MSEIFIINEKNNKVIIKWVRKIFKRNANLCYLYMYICVYTYVHIHKHTHTHKCIYTHITMHVPIKLSMGIYHLIAHCTLKAILKFLKCF